MALAGLGWKWNGYAFILFHWLAMICQALRAGVIGGWEA
jgi:hypothetical protein